MKSYLLPQFSRKDTKALFFNDVLVFSNSFFNVFFLLMKNLVRHRHFADVYIFDVHHHHFTSLQQEKEKGDELKYWARSRVIKIALIMVHYPFNY